MTKAGGAPLISSLVALLAVAHGAAQAVSRDADYWPVSKGNQYSADPIIARRLRCAALVEAIGTVYFSPAGFHYDPAERLRIKEMIAETPRMPAADAAERRAYAQASYDLYDNAEMLGRAKAKYSRTDFYGWYGDSQKREAISKVRGGTAYRAMSDPALRCFEYPQIAALHSAIKARLETPVPGTEIMASPRVQPGWMPIRNFGYMYGPVTYRYLTCAGIAQAMATARFGAMPSPDAADPPGWAAGQSGARLDGSAREERAVYRKAVRDTFAAGEKNLVTNSAAERQSYLESFMYAEKAGATLVKNGVAAEAMAEPALRCADIPSMAAIVQWASAGPAASADGVGKPAGFVDWPDRTYGYFANPVAFRSLFCAALVDTAYNRSVPFNQWFAPPREAAGSGQDAEISRARQAVRALYEKGKIDEDARTIGNMSVSEYARTYRRATDDAKNVIEQGRGLAALNHASTNCFALPELAPVAEAVSRRIQQ